MKRDAQSLGAVNVRQAGWVGNDDIRDKWTPTIIRCIAPRVFLDLVQMCAVAHLEAGSPTPIKHLLHLPTTFLNRTAPNRTHIWKQPRILDHEGHQLLWVPTDIEELQVGIEDEVSKGQVRGKSDPMAMRLEFLPESDKWLNVSAGPNHLDNDVEVQREIFAFLLGYPGGAICLFDIFEVGWCKSALEI